MKKDLKAFCKEVDPIIGSLAELMESLQAVHAAAQEAFDEKSGNRDSYEESEAGQKAQERLDAVQEQIDALEAVHSDVEGVVAALQEIE